MDNASKALYMAGALLVALLVISLLVYAFNNIGSIQNEKDQQTYEQSVTDFNKEYEAYNKKIMYGADVLSCLNKAVSNNSKYVKGGRWSITGASDEVDGAISITVNLKSDLIETFELKASSGSKLYDTKLSSGSKYNLQGKKILDLFGLKNKKLLTKVESDTTFANYTDMSNPTKHLGDNGIATVSSIVIKGGKTLRLDYNSDEDNELYKLSMNASDLKYIADNKNYEIEQKSKNIKEKENVWYSVEWTTALYNFKKLKFKCDSVKYNSTTGRIKEIVFIEK